MTCDRCGSETTRSRFCRECGLLESVENEAAHRDAPPLYECSQCGEERAESPAGTCWLCRSDRHQKGDDGTPEVRTDGGEEFGRGGTHIVRNHPVMFLYFYVFLAVPVAVVLPRAVLSTVLGASAMVAAVLIAGVQLS